MKDVHYGASLIDEVSESPCSSYSRIVLRRQLNSIRREDIEVPEKEASPPTSKEFISKRLTTSASSRQRLLCGEQAVAILSSSALCSSCVQIGLHFIDSSPMICL